MEATGLEAALAELVDLLAEDAHLDQDARGELAAGLIGGPIAFYAGAGLGAVTFTNQTLALAVIGEFQQAASPLFEELYLEEGLDRGMDQLMAELDLPMTLDDFIYRPMFVTVNGFGYLRYDMRPGWHVVADVRAEVYQHLQRLSLRFYEDKQTGQLMSRASSDLSQVRLIFAMLPITLANVAMFLVVIAHFAVPTVRKHTLDEIAAERAAQVRRDLEAAGTPIGMADYLIAEEKDLVDAVTAASTGRSGSGTSIAARRRTFPPVSSSATAQARGSAWRWIR